MMTTGARRSVQFGVVLGVLLTSACSTPNAAKTSASGSTNSHAQTTLSPVTSVTTPPLVATPLTPMLSAIPDVAPSPAVANRTDGTTRLTLGTGAHITVIGSSGTDIITVGAPTQSVIAGTGKDTVNLPANLASAKVIGHSPAMTTLHIITPGTANLSDQDRNFTVKLTPGINDLTLGHGANITAVGTPGADTITVGAPTQSVIAGSGIDTVKAPSDLAGVKVVGHGQATTTLVITTAGNARLNNADSNLTVELNGGASRPSLHHFATDVHPHAWRRARSSRHWHTATRTSKSSHGAKALKCSPNPVSVTALK
jgi:hypothetical protein